jgi:rhodanese-related sulfurtransferase
VLADGHIPRMKKWPVLFAFLSLFSSLFAAEVPALTPAEAAQLVADGKAVLIDVREPSEWTESGVAAPAVLLPKSEFDEGLIGDWKGFLAKVGDKQIITYCRSGKRSAAVAEALAAKGHKVANAGGFKAWQDAGLPVRQATEPAK